MDKILFLQVELPLTFVQDRDDSEYPFAGVANYDDGNGNGNADGEQSH